MSQVVFLYGPYDGCKVSVNDDVPAMPVTMGFSPSGAPVVYMPLSPGKFIYEPMKDCKLV